MNNTTHAGKLLEKIRLDPEFRRLWYTAYKDNSRKKECIQRARKLFKLSPAWEAVFLPIIFSEAPSDLIHIKLSIPQLIHENKDPVTGEIYYSLPIYPESTLAGVKEAYKEINTKYKSQGRKTTLRQTKPELDKIQYLALELRSAGKSYAAIADTIDETFDVIYTKEEIPLLVERAKKKSNR